MSPIRNKAAKVLKLKLLFQSCCDQWRLYIRYYHIQAVRVQALQYVFATPIWVGFVEQTAVQVPPGTQAKGLQCPR
jgi:hypothetical protein